MGYTPIDGRPAAFLPTWGSTIPAAGRPVILVLTRLSLAGGWQFSHVLTPWTDTHQVKRLHHPHGSCPGLDHAGPRPSQLRGRALYVDVDVDIEFEFETLTMR